MKRNLIPTCLAFSIALGGCADSHSSVTPVRSGLLRAQSCQELETALQDDAIAKIRLEGKRYQDLIAHYGLGGNVDYDVSVPSSVDAGTSNDDAPGAPRGEGQEASGGDGSDGRSFSETNTQVAGVDEADFVKTDGTRIYVASGKNVHVLNAWPANTTALERTIELEGHASELFVAGDQVVVFETVPGSAELGGANLCQRSEHGDDIRMFDDGGAEPSPDPGPAPAPMDAGVPEETPEPSDDGGIDPDEPVMNDAGVPNDGDAPDRPADSPPVDEDAYCYGSFTKVTVLDLTSMTPSSETYYEGGYVSSRRHGDAVRAVIQSAVRPPQTLLSIDQYIRAQDISFPETDAEAQQVIAAWVDAASDAARQTQLADWLPARAARVDGALQALAPDCTNFYLPSPGLTAYGLTQIAAVSLADGELGGATILGAAAHVYANHASLVLAQPDWSWNLREAEGSQTALHQFALGSDLETTYQGSGFAPGNLLNQFSIHEKDGTLFVATTQDLWGGWPEPVAGTPGQPGETVEVDAGSSEGSGGSSSGGGSSEPVPPETDAGVEEDGIGSSENPLDMPEPPYSYVTALQLQDGALVVVGQSPILAPGERIFSARFVGDRAYVVTFRQVDPLFALDIANPTDIRVLGELKIPGFSNYMHPLDDNHLLTIGREVNPETNRDEGLALQIFDVSDATAPSLAHKHVFTRTGWSEANSNHKAFTYYAEKSLLAFPFVSYDNGFESTLQIFHVDASTGFASVGEVAHTNQVTEACGWEGVEPAPADFVRGCSLAPEIRRGLFIEDNVYAISWAGVSAHALSNLAAPLASVTWQP